MNTIQIHGPGAAPVDARLVTAITACHDDHTITYTFETPQGPIVAKIEMRTEIAITTGRRTHVLQAQQALMF